MGDQVTEIKQKTDIVSLISERVKLTRAGKHFKGLCPFHSEKTPSFTVSTELQIFKCFGCGKAGDCYNFLQEYEGMDFAEALKYLAQKTGIILTRAITSNSSEKELLIQINTLSSKFYNYILTSHASGKDAQIYLMQERGVSGETIELFGLGYAPVQPRALLNFLVNKKHYKYSDLEKAGVALYQKDRFRGRIIFPLYDPRGNNVGLAGRIMPSLQNKNVGKYINSPETLIYHKSSCLYGLNVARPFIKKSEVAVVVEGELDCISSFQAGVKNVVAIKGSALTQEQILILSRLAQTIILALDNDSAGNDASLRAIGVAEKLGVQLKVMKASSYKDPDEFARSDPGGYKLALREAEGIWDFIIRTTVSKWDVTTGEGKGAVSRRLVPMLASIENEIVRAHYTDVIASRLSVPFEAVSSAVNKFTKFAGSEQKVELVAPKEEKVQKHYALEDEVLGMALLAQSVSQLLSKSSRKLFKNPVNKRILEELEKYFDAKKSFDLKQFLEVLPAELKEKYQNLILSQNQQFSPSEVRKYWEALRFAYLKDKMQKCAIKIRKFEESGNEAMLKVAQNKFQKLSQLLPKVKLEV